MRSLLCWVSLSLTVCSGCTTAVTWLPDSSGFVYTDGDGRLYLSKLDKISENRLLGATNTKTSHPAVDPGGKKIAVASIANGPGDGEQVQLIFYDLDGRELSRSKTTEFHGGKDFKELGELFWSARQPTKILVANEGQSAVYDTAADAWISLPNLVPIKLAGSPFVPETDTLLAIKLKPGAAEPWVGVSQVELDGKETPLTMEPQLLIDPNLRLIVAAPHFYRSYWKGRVGYSQWSDRCIEFDLAGRSVKLTKIPIEYTEKQEIIQDVYAFAGEAARVRFIELEPRYQEGQPPADAASVRAQLKSGVDRDTQFGRYRIEIGYQDSAGKFVPRKVLSESAVFWTLEPSPDGKHLALRFNEDSGAVLGVVSSDGRIELLVSERS